MEVMDSYCLVIEFHENLLTVFLYLFLYYLWFLMEAEVGGDRENLLATLGIRYAHAPQADMVALICQAIRHGAGQPVLGAATWARFCAKHWSHVFM